MPTNLILGRTQRTFLSPLRPPPPPLPRTDAEGARLRAQAGEREPREEPAPQAAATSAGPGCGGFGHPRRGAGGARAPAGGGGAGTRAAARRPLAAGSGWALRGRGRRRGGRRAVPAPSAPAPRRPARSAPAAASPCRRSGRTGPGRAAPEGTGPGRDRSALRSAAGRWPNRKRRTHRLRPLAGVAWPGTARRFPRGGAAGRPRACALRRERAVAAPRLGARRVLLQPRLGGAERPGVSGSGLRPRAHTLTRRSPVRLRAGC